MAQNSDWLFVLFTFFGFCLSLCSVLLTTLSSKFTMRAIGLGFFLQFTLASGEVVDASHVHKTWIFRKGSEIEYLYCSILIHSLVVCIGQLSGGRRDKHYLYGKIYGLISGVQHSIRWAIDGKRSCRVCRQIPSKCE